MKIFISVIIFALFVAPAQARIVTKNVEYTHGNTLLEGFMAYDDAEMGKRPGVLIIHEWWGLNDYARERAKQIAKSGYVAFALDMFGKGVVTADPAEAGKLAGPFRGTPLMGQRALAGKEAFLKAAKYIVDKNRIAAIGFCFGGTTALELAYTGTDLRGVVSFHGNLPPVPPESMKKVKAKILVLHGADDFFISNENILQFQQSMRQAALDWQMYYFGNAVHSFTNPDAGKSNIKGVAYHEPSEKRSWKAMQRFLEEIF